MTPGAHPAPPTGWGSPSGGETLTRFEASHAYGAFCRRVFGLDLRQFDLLDAGQLEALLAALALTPGERVLDLGCGTGSVALHIAEVTGARLFGLDLAPAAIRRARAHRAGGARLHVLVGDLAQPALAEASFDALIAIDSLYHAPGVEAGAGRIVELLRPGGRMAFLCSELVSGGWGMAPADIGRRTPLGRALVARGLEPTVEDLTAHEEEIWRRQEPVLRELRAAFEEEGNGDLWRLLDREARRGRELVASGRLRRYLYLARRAPQEAPGARSARQPPGGPCSAGSR